jgi:hypothetical protein
MKHQRAKFGLLKTNLKASTKKKKKVECGEKMSGERKERVRKEECVGKVGEIPYTCLFF